MALELARRPVTHNDSGRIQAVFGRSFPQILHSVFAACLLTGGGFIMTDVHEVDQLGDISEIDIPVDIPVSIAVFLTAERLVAYIDTVNQPGNIGKVAITVGIAVDITGVAARELPAAAK